MKEGCNSIVITLSQQTIKERRGGYKKIISEWLISDGELTTWWYKIGTAPKKAEDIEWVYWVINGRIRWRCRLLQIEKNMEKQFGEAGNVMYSKNWLVLFDFESLPKLQQIKKQGFQGFRYFDET